MDNLQALVINDFIRLTERVANGKTNMLNFGSGMTFYRGEIHMIQMVGDCPGIYISEMARAFHITRAVVAKTVRKLESRGLVIKTSDHEDKKRLRLFLTEKGSEAYSLHHQYHQQSDRPLFVYLESLSESELHTLREFLRHANNLVENHY